MERSSLKGQNLVLSLYLCASVLLFFSFDSGFKELINLLCICIGKSQVPFVVVMILIQDNQTKTR